MNVITKTADLYDTYEEKLQGLNQVRDSGPAAMSITVTKL